MKLELMSIEEATRYWHTKVESGHTCYGKECTPAVVRYHPQPYWRAFVANITYPTPLGVPATDTHYIFFKKFLINQFNREYKKGPGVRLVLDAVQYVVEKRAFLSVVLENGEIYDCPAKDFYQWVREHSTIKEASWNPVVKEGTAPTGIMRKVYPTNGV